MHYPAVTGPTLPDGSEEVHIDLPEYDIRCLATARDPLAVIEAHRLNVCFRLAWLLGLRMCPDCPRCNDCGWGCQDLFGCNMRPTGGVPCSESMEVCCNYLEEWSRFVTVAEVWRQQIAVIPNTEGS